MVRLRHWNRLQRTVLLAMAALLWSQFALAGHGACLGIPGTPAAFAAAAPDVRHDHGHGCDAEIPSASEALCSAHCTEGDLSADSGRLPWIPPLPVGEWFPWFAVAGTAAGSPGVPPTWVDAPSSEAPTSELQSLMRISYADFCLTQQT